MTKLALIGVGRWGSNIKNTLESFKGVDVVTLEKNDELSLKSTKLKDINGVLIATPGTTHAKIALPFIQKGLPTYIEKPMTTSAKDAQDLQQAATKSGAPVMIGHIHLYNPAYQTAKALLKKAGPIRTIHFEGINYGPIRDDMSVLWDWGPHGISLMLDLLQQKPSTIQAWGTKTLRPSSNLYDEVFVKLNFPKNISGTMRVSWLSPEKSTKLTVVSKKSAVIFDDTGDKKVTLVQNLSPKLRGKQVLPQKQTTIHPRFKNKSPLTAELSHFLDVIKSGRKPHSDIAQGLQVVQIIEAAHQSLKLNGKAIRTYAKPSNVLHL